MRVEVRGKSFDIDLVNNYVHEQYSKLTEMSYDLVSLADEVGNLQPGEIAAGVKRIRADSNAKKRELCEVRDDIVRELLESNGYEFDGEWWKRKTSPDDMNEFMVECVKRDSKGTVKKK